MTSNKDRLPFSQRYGFEPTEIPFQLDKIDDNLRVDLWNSFYLFIYAPLKNAQYGTESFRHIFRVAWIHFFRKPFDDFPDRDYDLTDLVKNHIEKEVWFKVYNFFEFIFKNLLNSELYDLDSFISYIDNMLERNHSGYRIINYKFIPVTNETEITEIKKVDTSSRAFGLTGIIEHLNSSLELISKKPKPDIRNSIKESICMVEVISRIIEPSENTLGKALNKLEKNQKINQTLKLAFEKLYAYTNTKNGIRHALMEEENLGFEDGKFFLVACSAFTNYLIEKASKADLLKTT